MLLHAQYESLNSSGETPVVINSQDTDVLIIATASTKNIMSHLYFYTGKAANKRTIDIQAVQRGLGDDVTEAPIGLHCFTACDSVSAFFLKGKMKTLKQMKEDTDSVNELTKLGDNYEVGKDLLKALEIFVCKLYGNKDVTSVNEIRYSMFKQAKKVENNMPPNCDSLHKHILRANFQAKIYKLSLTPKQDLPSPKDHGWKFDDDGNLIIDWMSLPSAPDSINELAYCNCKKSNCQAPKANDKCCVSLGLKCTALCQCKGCVNTCSLSDDDAELSDAEDEDDVDDN